MDLGGNCWSSCPKFTWNPHFFDVLTKKSKKIEICSELLATFQAIYIYCVGCAQEFSSKNSSSRRHFTWNPQFFDISAENSKLIEISSDRLGTFQSTCVCCLECSQKVSSKNSSFRRPFTWNPVFSDVSAENSNLIITFSDRLAALQPTYIYCVECWKKKLSKNKTCRWYFTWHKHFAGSRPKNS